MRARRTRRTRVTQAATAAGAVVAAIAIGAVPAFGAPSGDASGANVDLVTPITSISLPPTPLVTLPPGGSVSVGSLNVPGVLGTGALNAATQATSATGASSQASVANVSALPGVAPLTAGLVSSSCSADATGASGTSSVAGGTFAGTPLAVSPNPNTTVGVPPLGSVVLNEQQTTPTGIRVRAVHVSVNTPLGVNADIGIASVACDSGLDVLGLAVAASPTRSTPSLAG